MAATIITGAVIAVCAVLAVNRIRKKGTCGCGCRDCQARSSCSKHSLNEK
jgi:hypothetical protein